MPTKVIWHLRMNGEGRTCLARELFDNSAIAVVRMQERMELGLVTVDELREGFPFGLSVEGAPSEKIIEAAKQYLIHAVHAGAPREVVDFLTKLYRPRAAFRAQLDAMLTPEEKRP